VPGTSGTSADEASLRTRRRLRLGALPSGSSTPQLRLRCKPHVDPGMVTNMVLPATFMVGAAVPSRGGTGRLTAYGGGRLTVTPGSIVLEPGVLTRRYTKVDRLTHTKPDVTMLKTRMPPPFVNTRLRIEDDDVVAVASVPGWSRRRLREALREAGFDVHERFGRSA